MGHHANTTVGPEEKAATKAQAPMTSMMLKTAEPMTPLIPISSFDTKTPITVVANSGPDEPAAMKVAPATSADKCKAAKE